MICMIYDGYMILVAMGRVYDYSVSYFGYNALIEYCKYTIVGYRDTNSVYNLGQVT